MNNRVLIIGAGAAGITAGVHLCKQGYTVRILERRSFPGGRAYSIKDALTGEMVDNGQHLLAGAYHHFLGLLKTLGTDDKLYFQKSLKVGFIENGNHALLNTGLLPGKTGIALGLLLFKALSCQSKTGIIKFYLRLRSGKIDVGSETVEELLKREKQTEEAIRKFWRPIVVSALNASISKAASSLFITVMLEAFFSTPANSRLIFPTTDFNELFNPASHWLQEHGSSLMLNTSVKKLIFEQDRIVSVRTNKEEITDFDYVIAAVPPDNLLKVIPDDFVSNDYFKPLEGLTFSTIISSSFWFDRDLFKDDFAAILGSPLHWVFNRRRICRYNKSLEGNYPNCLSFTISDAGSLADLSIEKIRETLYNEILTVFPEAKEATLLHSKIVIEKKATPVFTPQSELIRPTQRSPIRNLFTAGDWTATGLPATLEGAARSGILAADAIIECNI